LHFAGVVFCCQRIEPVSESRMTHFCFAPFNVAFIDGEEGGIFEGSVGLITQGKFIQYWRDKRKDKRYY
jgi:hypothetical protein